MAEQTARKLRAVIGDPSLGRFTLICDKCGTSELLGEHERPHDGAVRHIEEQHIGLGGAS